MKRNVIWPVLMILCVLLTLFAAPVMATDVQRIVVRSNVATGHNVAAVQQIVTPACNTVQQIVTPQVQHIVVPQVQQIVVPQVQYVQQVQQVQHVQKVQQVQQVQKVQVQKVVAQPVYVAPVQQVLRVEQPRLFQRSVQRSRIVTR